MNACGFGHQYKCTVPSNNALFESIGAISDSVTVVTGPELQAEEEADV